MTTIEELKGQLTSMLDATEDKQAIEQIGALNNLVNKIETEHTQLVTEQKELLKDYRELVKHTSFQPTGKEQEEVPETSVLTVDSFLDDYFQKQEAKKNEKN